MDLWGLYLVGDIHYILDLELDLDLHREQINSSKEKEKENPHVRFLQPMRTIQGS